MALNDLGEEVHPRTGNSKKYIVEVSCLYLVLAFLGIGIRGLSGVHYCLCYDN